MAQTYSQSITGINAGTVFTPKTVQVGDLDAAGGALDSLSGGTGAQQRVTMRGNQILCKNPDGSQSWYTIDAERSVPGVSLVMRPVGP